MAAPIIPTLTILPAIAIGAVIGLYEIILIHRDVQVASHRFGHSIHAFVLAIVASVISFNIPLAYILIPQLKTIPVLNNEIGVRIALGLIMAIKIHGTSAALKNIGMSTAGLQETWFHSIIIGSLTATGPYLYPFVAPMLPAWMK